jgi:hypothetical protein
MGLLKAVQNGFSDLSFCHDPGGLTWIAIVAVDIGADPAISILFNICRIVTILIVVPIIADIIVRY